MRFPERPSVTDENYIIPPEHPEFSDIGRDSRFLSGWWIAPMTLFSLAMWLGAIVGLLKWAL